MDASVKKIMDDLKAGKYAPVYFLQGEETFYIDLIANYIEANALQPADKSFNQVIVYGKDAAMATILLKDCVRRWISRAHTLYRECGLKLVNSLHQQEFSWQQKRKPQTPRKRSCDRSRSAES